MRRVYFYYGLSLLKQPIFWQALFLPVAAALLAKWLFVAKIIENFLSVPVKAVPGYIWRTFYHAFENGEGIVAVVFVLATVTGVSLLYHLGRALLVMERGKESGLSRPA